MTQWMERTELFLRKIYTVGKVSFREIVRDKILYNSVLCASVLVSLSFIASQLTYATQTRVIVNFGLMTLTFASVAIAILISAPMLNREIERRTAFVILSKPISRLQFMLGKQLGLTFVLITNWLLLSVVFLFIYLTAGGQLHMTLGWALIYVLIQSLWVMALAVMFSAYSTPAVSALLTLGVYMIGSNISQIRLFIRQDGDSTFSQVLNTLIGFLPNFETFTLGMKTVYQIPISPAVVFFSLAYALFWMLIFVLLSGILFNRKEI